MNVIAENKAYTAIPHGKEVERLARRSYILHWTITTLILTMDAEYI